MKKILIVLAAMVCLSKAPAQAQSVSLNDVCLLTTWQTILTYTDTASGDTATLINDSILALFDTLYATGNCDSISMMAKIHGLPNYFPAIKIATAKKLDSCQLSVDIAASYQSYLPDTVVNFCGTISVENFSPALKTSSSPSLFAYPSPAAPNTSVYFMLPHAGEIRLALYDMQGRHLKTLVQGPQSAGFHRVAFDGARQNGEALSKGIYVVRLTGLGKTTSLRLLLVR